MPINVYTYTHIYIYLLVLMILNKTFKQAYLNHKSNNREQLMHYVYVIFCWDLASNAATAGAVRAD